MKAASPLLCALLLAASVQAQAATSYHGDDLLVAAGLTPHSTVKDAVRLFGHAQAMGTGGIEFLKPGSLADAWMTFQPAGNGGSVYVDCDEAPANLPEDVVKALCRVALHKDWRVALPGLKQILSAGRPTPGVGDKIDVDDDTDADSDESEFDAVVTLSRTYQAARYTVIVAVSPKVATPRDGSSHAGVIVTWIAT